VYNPLRRLKMNYDFGTFGQVENIATVPLEQITRQKFGQPGVDAIQKYPCLQGAKIAGFLYMEEAGGNTFNLRRLKNGAMFARNIDGCEPFISNLNKLVYQPAVASPFTPTMIPRPSVVTNNFGIIAVGAGLLLVIILALLLRR